MNLIIVPIAILLSTVLHYLIQQIFIYYKRFDDFNHRSSHNTLATRTGGIGVFVTTLIISLVFYFKKVELFDYKLFIPLSIMFIIGVYDDLYRADFKLKFLLQIIVAKILIDQGYVISNYYGLFGFYEVPWLLAQFSTVFVFLVIVNAFNFIDGIDGLAISQVIKTIFLIEFLSNVKTPLLPMGVITIASIIPLYYFNLKKKRKIFLGDSGSLFLGTVIAIYCFYLLGKSYTLIDGLKINKTFFSIILITYPLFDLLRVITLRLKNKKSPFEPDQNHLHHKVLILFKKNQLNSLIFILIIDIIVLLSLLILTKSINYIF